MFIILGVSSLKTFEKTFAIFSESFLFALSTAIFKICDSVSLVAEIILDNSFAEYLLSNSFETSSNIRGLVAISAYVFTN